MDISKEEKEKIRETIEKLKQSKFKQQTLPVWRPIPTYMSTMLQFAVFAVIFLSIGILLVVKNNEVQEISIKYDSLCRDELQSGKYCTINLKEITKEMKGPFTSIMSSVASIKIIEGTSSPEMMAN